MDRNKVTADLIELIVTALGGKAINDPRILAHRTSPLDRYVRAEIRRIIDRLRSPHPESVDMPTHADIRRAVDAIGKVRVTATLDAAHTELQKLQLEPPERTDPLKHQCAEEAWYLMVCYSPKCQLLKKSKRSHVPPSGHRDGPFHKIAGLIHNAVAGSKSEENMRNACDLVRRAHLDRD